MKTIVLLITIAAASLCWGQQGGPCPNGQGMYPYCDLNNPPNQFHTTPPPAYEPNKDSDNFAKEMQELRRQQKVDACKATCGYDLSRPTCEQQCKP